MLSSFQAYGEFIYTIQSRFAGVRASTLVLKPRGVTMGELTGELEFDQGVVLRVMERIDFDAARIEYYSYTVSRAGERLYWYDPQPHPTDATLASTHPHHKHTAPDLKHHRVRAPGLSFTQPNLPFLIQEIETPFGT